MSLPEAETKPTPETKLMELMSNIFKVDYALDEEDRDVINRMIQWGTSKEGLTRGERDTLIRGGVMDKDDTFLVPNEFWFRGLIMPSYWLKCLMAFNGLVNFTGNMDGEEKP